MFPPSNRTLHPRPREVSVAHHLVRHHLVRLGVEPPLRTVIRKDMRLRAAIVVGVAWFIVACADPEGSSPSTSLDFPSATATSITEMAVSNTPTVVTSTSVSATRVEGLLFDFDSPGSVDGWYVQNDTVMGGVSSSSVNWDDGDLVFSGVLSTENNGGFASTRGPIIEAITEPVFDAIAVESQGDGRTYLLQVRTDTDNYVQRFTPQSMMSKSMLALDDFVATDWRLEPLANRPPLMSNAIRQLAIYLLDKQVGEFVLRVGSFALVSS